MPQPDPWAKFRQTPPDPKPEPAPLPAPTLEDKRRTEARAAEQNMDLQQRSSNRADASLQMEAERLRIAQEEAERKAKAAEITGGVNPTESEATASYLTTLLENDVREIERQGKAHPDAFKPGWVETIGATIGGERGRALATSSETQDARQIIHGRYLGAVDSILKLGTGAAYTKEELENYAEVFAPQVTDSPAVLQDKAKRLREAVLAARVKSGVGVENVNRAMAAIDQLYGNPAYDEQGNIKHSLSDIDTPTTYDISPDGDKKTYPLPPEMNAENAAWVRANPGASVADYIKFRKELDAKYNIPADMKQGYEGRDPEYEEFLKFYREHPSSDIPDLMYTRPLGVAEKFANTLSKPFSEETVNLAATVGNAVTGGLPEAMLDPASKASFEEYRARNPKTTLLGEIGGAAVPTALLEKGLTKLAVKGLGKALPKTTSTLANAAYGAARGAASADEGEGISEAAKGAALGVAGEALGRTVGRGARGWMKPETRAAVDELLAQGADLTTAQRAGLGKLEELGQGIPIVRGAREAANDSWNVSNVNKALSFIGEKLPKGIKAEGGAANEAANKILNARYNSIRPQVVGSFDQQFKSATAALKAAGRSSPLKRKLYAEIAEIEKTFIGGKYDGNTFKDADARLRNLSSDWMAASAETTTSPSVYHEMGRLAESFRKQLRMQVARNTPDVGVELKKLDRAWARMVQLEKASIKDSVNLTYSPRELLNTIKQLDTSPRKGAFARGKAFGQKEAQAAADVLGSKKVPETESWFQTGGMGYLAKQALGIPATLTAGAAAYAPGIKRITQAILAGDRNKLIPKKLSDSILGQIPPEVIAAAILRAKQEK